MGKHKKKFIDKKKAVTFHLVNRSQHDPLITDENAPQHVLVEAKPLEPKERKEEQKKFGIFYDDDYDYLQHMKKPGKHVVWEYVEIPNNKRNDELEDKTAPIQLPSSVFASTYEETEGMLNKAAPNPGPKPDWDPDVVAALDDDFDYDNPENHLEDDFFVKAMDEVEDEDDKMNYDEDDEDGYIDSDGPFSEDDDDDMSGDELRDRLGALMRDRRFDNEEIKSRFTEYSMSSSVIRRNEQLSLLDDRFEKFYTTYDDPELGALDLEDIEGYMDQEHLLSLNCCMEFKRSTEFDQYKKEWDKNRIQKYREIHSSDEEDFEVKEVEDDKEKKWDCESILSTYSNIYNHPKLIEEPRKNNRTTKIEIDPKTGLPKDALRGNDKLTTKSLAKHDNEIIATNLKCGPKSLCDKSVLSTISVLSIRPKDETLEEKRERKRLLKEYRAERRLERKANAEAFKEEKKRLEKIKINNQNNIQGNRIC